MESDSEKKKEMFRKLEDRLADKFDLLQLAREQGMGDLFDQYSRSLEVLLTAHPRAYQEFNAEKDEMVADLNRAYEQIRSMMEKAPDALTRDHFARTNQNKVDWEFRNLYEETMMGILSKYNLIPIREHNVTRAEPVEKPHPKQQPQMQKPQEKEEKKSRLLPETRDKFKV